MLLAELCHLLSLGLVVVDVFYIGATHPFADAKGDAGKISGSKLALVT